MYNELIATVLLRGTVAGMNALNITGVVYQMNILHATNKKQHIEKFKGKFDDVDGGCTIIHTKSLQLIFDLFLIGLYSHLCSKPENWKIIPKQLSVFFKVGIKKIYKALNDLIMIGLIERIELRKKGRFVDYEYYLYLSPNGQNGSSDNLPSGQKPLGGEPNGQNGCTYKEDTSLEKKEEKKGDFILTSTPKPPSIEDQQEYNYFFF